MALQRPEIGVIAESPLQRHVLQKVLSAYGLTVTVNCGPELFGQQPDERIQQIGCWLVEIDDEELEAPVLESLFDLEDVPILFGLGKAPEKHDELYISWERRLFAKLEEHLGRLEILDSEESILALDIANEDRHVNARAERLQPAREVWILAASLGGPAAVKEFLDGLPADLDVGFLYAQHVDPHFSNVLTQVLSRHSELDLKPLESARPVYAGEILMVPVDREVSFGGLGAMIKDSPWQGPYGPSIDQLMANAFNHYGKNCHAIVFSGMGNDGALTASRMRRAGCEIWTQTPQTCANSSMPDSIIDLNCSTFTAAPKELAQALIARCAEQASSNSANQSEITNNTSNQQRGD